MTSWGVMVFRNLGEAVEIDKPFWKQGDIGLILIFFHINWWQDF